MRPAKYIGSRPDLRNKTALLRSDPEDADSVLAQFDDIRLLESCAWHRFKRSDFRPLTNLTMELLAALEEVVAISDRKHDAWDRAHAAINKARKEFEL